MIDAKIRGGDVAVDSAGRIERIRGRDVLFQRALLCLTVPRGSFIYDRELGSGAVVPNAPEKTELSLNEGLARYENTYVKVLEQRDSGITAEIVIDGESRVEEVKRYGDV